MRFTAIVALALAAVASAATLSPRAGLPACANTCFNEIDSEPCSKLDISCLCHNQAFRKNMTSCIKSKCSSSDQQMAQVFFNDACGSRFSGDAVTEDKGVVDN